ncbi:MAG: mechanosensitive ion channel family protein [Candidatus Methylacidiphilales bacterium]
MFGSILQNVVGEDLSLLQKMLERASGYVVDNSFKLLGAALIIAIGWFLANSASKWFVRLGNLKKLDITLTRFLAGALRIAILILAFIMALNKFDIAVTPLVAMIGAGTLGISLALQGPLSNYGSGLIIVISRPFVVGDTLTLLGHSGVVEEVKLGFTRLITEDGEVVTIPNRHIVGEIQINSKNLRIVEGVVGIEYGADVSQAIQIITEAIKQTEDVSSGPAPLVGIEAFGDSSINLGYRYWIPSRRFHELRFKVNASIWHNLKTAGINIPYPQRVLHISSGPLSGTSTLSS